MRAIEGYSVAKGLKKNPKKLPAPTPEERAELHRKIAEMEKRRKEKLNGNR